MLLEVAVQVGLLAEATVAQVALEGLFLVVDVADVTLQVGGDAEGAVAVFTPGRKKAETFPLSNYYMSKKPPKNRKTQMLLVISTTVQHNESGANGLFCGKHNEIHNVLHTYRQSQQSHSPRHDGGACLR